MPCMNHRYTIDLGNGRDFVLPSPAWTDRWRSVGSQVQVGNGQCFTMSYWDLLRALWGFEGTISEEIMFSYCPPQVSYQFHCNSRFWPFTCDSKCYHVLSRCLRERFQRTWLSIQRLVVFLRHHQCVISARSVGHHLTKLPALKLSETGETLQWSFGMTLGVSRRRHGRYANNVCTYYYYTTDLGIFRYYTMALICINGIHSQCGHVVIPVIWTRPDAARDLELSLLEGFFRWWRMWDPSSRAALWQLVRVQFLWNYANICKLSRHI